MEGHRFEDQFRMTIVVDAHEDIAWNMLSFGRDYFRSVEQTRGSELGSYAVERNGTTLLGWPEWVSGRVAIIFASLYVSPSRWQEHRLETQVYSDYAGAKRLYWGQMDVYTRMAEEQGEKVGLVRTLADLESILKTWDQEPPDSPRVGLVIAMEGAEGITDLAELEEWVQRGVRILGPCWSGTRFAGGTREPGPLTDQGRDLLEAMAEVGLILDLSHMAEEATLEALDRYEGAVIATHSNARALLSGVDFPDRHLSDEVIRGIAERGGVIGVVPLNSFLSAEWRKGDPRDRVTLEHVVDQIDHMCHLVGSAAHVAIGSDFDGGFGLEMVPTGLDSVADLRLIGDALGSRGYGQDVVTALLSGNWLRMLRLSLPES